MQNINVVEKQLKLNNIDFTAIRSDLCLSNEEGGFEWTLAEADEAIEAYLKFLNTVADYASGRSGVPLYHLDSKLLFEQAVPESLRQIVAIAWERHVLNTRQYTEDCQRIFKTYLHYSPSLFKENFSIIIP